MSPLSWLIACSLPATQENATVPGLLPLPQADVQCCAVSAQQCRCGGSVLRGRGNPGRMGDALRTGAGRGAGRGLKHLRIEHRAQLRLVGEEVHVQPVGRSSCRTSRAGCRGGGRAGGGGGSRRGLRVAARRHRNDGRSGDGRGPDGPLHGGHGAGGGADGHSGLPCDVVVGRRQGRQRLGPAYVLPSSSATRSWAVGPCAARPRAREGSFRVEQVHNGGP